MKRIAFLFLMLFCTYTVRAAVVDTITVHAAKMNKDVTVVVVVPDLGNEKALPVLYLLHGYGSDAFTWLRSMDVKDFADRYGNIDDFIGCTDNLGNSG